MKVVLEEVTKENAELKKLVLELTKKLKHIEKRHKKGQEYSLGYQWTILYSIYANKFK